MGFTASNRDRKSYGRFRQKAGQDGETGEQTGSQGGGDCSNPGESWRWWGQRVTQAVRSGQILRLFWQGTGLLPGRTVSEEEERQRGLEEDTLANAHEQS